MRILLCGTLELERDILRRMSTPAAAQETRSGLSAWNRAELPQPPVARELSLMGSIGPGAIILGLSIGSGEWLIGPG